MTVSYEAAIQVWGRQKLRDGYRYAGGVILDDLPVSVEFEFNAGDACCGGTDPNCYCSFAESPSFSIKISQGKYQIELNHYSFDFETIIREIVIAGGGTISVTN